MIQKGFTLWEILITTAIMAVITALTIPGMSNYTQQKKDMTIAIKLVNNFKYLRTEAIHLNTKVTVCGMGFIEDVGFDDSTCSNGLDYSGGMIAFIDYSSISELNKSSKILKSSTFEVSKSIKTIVTSNSKLFIINSDGNIIALKKDNSISPIKNMCFSIHKITDSKEELKVKINPYGASETCIVGVDCSGIDKDPDCME